MTAKNPGESPKLSPALDKRKAFILATVVYEYVATAEPVGSQTLTQKYNLGVSSATIRNEMAELEAAGYLVQPHTSAGRVPSDAGYRTYVDHLMRPETLASDEQARISERFRAASRELDDVIEQTTRLLGELTRNVAFAIAPTREQQAFRHVQLIWLSDEVGLAIVVTSLGSPVQMRFDHGGAAPDDLTAFSNRLNLRLGGKSLREVARVDLVAIAVEAGLSEQIGRAVEGALQAVTRAEEPVIASSGAQHLLDQPEFQDLRKLRSILRIIEEQRRLYEMVADQVTSESPTVKIGHELGHDEMVECSVVTVPYRFGEDGTGVLAILGPRRMPYARLLAIATGTASSLNRHLTDTEIR